MMFVGNKETYFECQKSCIMSDIQDGFFCKNNVLKVLIKPHSLTVFAVSILDVSQSSSYSSASANTFIWSNEF